MLLEPDGPIYLAGEHMSYLNGWQAGALESARVVAQLAKGRQQAVAIGVVERAAGRADGLPVLRRSLRHGAEPRLRHRFAVGHRDPPKLSAWWN